MNRQLRVGPAKEGPDTVGETAFPLPWRLPGAVSFFDIVGRPVHVVQQEVIVIILPRLSVHVLVVPTGVVSLLHITGVRENSESVAAGTAVPIKGAPYALDHQGGVVRTGDIVGSPAVTECRDSIGIINIDRLNHLAGPLEFTTGLKPQFVRIGNSPIDYAARIGRRGVAFAARDLRHSRQKFVVLIPAHDAHKGILDAKTIGVDKKGGCDKRTIPKAATDDDMPGTDAEDRSGNIDIVDGRFSNQTERNAIVCPCDGMCPLLLLLLCRDALLLACPVLRYPCSVLLGHSSTIQD